MLLHHGSMFIMESWSYDGTDPVVHAFPARLLLHDQEYLSM
jgi:uncharacterized membrane protein